MSFFGLFGSTQVEVEAQGLVDARWERIRLALNGDAVTRAQEVLFKGLLDEVVREQLENQRALRNLASALKVQRWLIVLLAGETIFVQVVLPLLTGG